MLPAGHLLAHLAKVGVLCDVRPGERDAACLVPAFTTNSSLVRFDDRLARGVQAASGACAPALDLPYKTPRMLDKPTSLTYPWGMRFVETTVFTAQVVGLLGDDEYRALQASMIVRPDQGALIRGSGGLRKVRWGVKGRGKRGGVRVIYYWWRPDETFLMLFLYAKNVQDDLEPAQLRALGQFVEKEYR